MDEPILKLLKENKIFALLDEATKADLLSKFSQIELHRGEILFNQGDSSDNVFFLVSGKLAAELTTTTGETKIIAHMEPGETVGELGALASEPRTFTIKALKDSTLLQLAAGAFIAICHKVPGVMLEIVHPIIQRSNNILQLLSAEKNNKHIVLVPANPEISLEKLSEKLLSLGENYPGLLIVSEHHTSFLQDCNDINTMKERIQQQARTKKSTHRVLYFIKSHDTLLAKIAFKKADIIYVVGDSTVEPKIDQHVLDKIHSHASHLRSDAEFILLHPAHLIMPKNTAAWLRLYPFTLHHHVRENMTKDHQRLLRFIRGKAVGLVLSGGGTRGWAHLGAIKALHEAKIPIDMIGGTSVGALVGAFYALHQSHEEAYNKFSRLIEISNHSVSWRNLTWPIISLFNAKGFTESQIALFGDQQIEDMWLPFFCISCNLSNNNETVHRTGLLWKKTRASSSIPGIIPPMVIDGELHLDGGLMNNLPTDVMRQFIGPKGKVVAIDLNAFSPDRHKYHFPPVLTFKEAFITRWSSTGKNTYKFPRFLDTFFRGLFIGSLAKSRQNSLAANIFVSLNLNKFRLLHSNPKQSDRLVEIGYQETLLKCMYQAVKKKM